MSHDVKKRPACIIKIGNFEKKVYFFEEVCNFSKMEIKQSFNKLDRTSLMESFSLEQQVHPNVLLQIPQEQIQLLQQQGKTYNTE